MSHSHSCQSFSLLIPLSNVYSLPFPAFLLQFPIRTFRGYLPNFIMLGYLLRIWFWGNSIYDHISQLLRHHTYKYKYSKKCPKYEKSSERLNVFSLLKNCKIINLNQDTIYFFTEVWIDIRVKRRNTVTENYPRSALAAPGREKLHLVQMARAAGAQVEGRELGRARQQGFGSQNIATSYPAGLVMVSAL